MKDAIEKARSYIIGKAGRDYRTALVLGSGLGFLADSMEDTVSIPYQDIPGFKGSTVHGHAGRLVCGTLNGKKVMIMQGRYHFYEGHTMQEITFPVRVFGALGIETLVITNAAGGINPFMEVGDLMLITDHINMGPNPLTGVCIEGLERFVPLDALYSPTLRLKARRIAEEEGITLREGVYLFTTGPSYETKAEIRMFHHLGADAVGMSTVPEAIVARHCNIPSVLAISLITNKTLGNYIPTHEEVIETGVKSREYFGKLVKRLVKEI